MSKDAKIVAEAKAVVEDIQTFTKFVEFQNRVLAGCGVSAETASAIAERVASLREKLASFSYNADEVHKHIAECCNSTCVGADQAEEYVADRLKRFGLDKETLLVQGSVLLIASGTITAMSLGATAPFTALSAAAGSILIAWSAAIENPVDKPPE